MKCIKERRIRRTIKQFGIYWVGEVQSEKAFRKRLETKGYHVVEIKRDGNRLFGWCIYIRNLPRAVQACAKTIKEYPKTGDTINFQVF